MASRSLDCPRCGGTLEAGYIADVMYGHGSAAVPNWVAGEPERSVWTGLKLRGKDQLPVTTYRCRRCGYLESYA